MSDEQHEKHDSLWPHAVAVWKHPLIQRVVKLGWPLLLALVLNPAWDYAKGWYMQVQQVQQDHRMVLVTGKRVTDLQGALAQTEHDRDAGYRRFRAEAAAMERQFVEYVAAARRQDVSKTLEDYDKLISKWRDGVHGALVCDLQTPDGDCHSPTEAASMALAVRRPAGH